MDEENKRQSPRHSVTLYTEQVERDVPPPRILNISEKGFLIRGDLCAGQGGVLRASFRVRPPSGERKVTARGTVVHARACGAEYEFGVRIDSFGSPEEEAAYADYVRELAAVVVRSSTDTLSLFE
jgi:hypothetical protein